LPQPLGLRGGISRRSGVVLPTHGRFSLGEAQSTLRSSATVRFTLEALGFDGVEQYMHALLRQIGRFFQVRPRGFMRIESDILVATLLSLMKQGITALPLHTPS
jgi:hypothetical protein